MKCITHIPNYVLILELNGLKEGRLYWYIRCLRSHLWEDLKLEDVLVNDIRSSLGYTISAEESILDGIVDQWEFGEH